MASIRKAGPYNPQKATAYVGKGVLKNGGKIVTVGGQTHKVFKKKVDKGIGDKGDIVVDHTAGRPAGKWDKINLTKKSRAKTVSQGVASVKKWHKDNPDYGKKRSMAKKRR
jgi:hypothetical protein